MICGAGPNNPPGSGPARNRLGATQLPSTILISSSVSPYNSYTSGSICLSVGLDLALQRLFLLRRLGLCLCSASMRSTSETTLSCRALSRPWISNCTVRIGICDKYSLDRFTVRLDPFVNLIR